MLLAAAVWTTIAVVALLLAEKARSRIGVWIAKPAASLGFVAVGLAALAAPDGTGTTALAHFILAALVLCALGDVLLIPEGSGPTFLAGVGAFALGHLLYACAFWTGRPQLMAAGAAALLMAAVVWRVLRWLAPHLGPPLDRAVRVYMLIIAAMVALAAGASSSTGDLRFAVGALAFAISDLSVARERFVQPSFANLAWGLPLYYAAQLVLASTAMP